MYVFDMFYCTTCMNKDDDDWLYSISNVRNSHGLLAVFLRNRVTGITPV